MTCDRRSFLASATAGTHKDHAILGDHGFEHAVEAVGRLEQAFGLDDLARLTA